MPDQSAKAPYNFVPLPERVYVPAGEAQIDYARYHRGRHTGVIEIGITTETWLYTRAAVAPAYAKEHPEQQRDVMAHPGSSAYREFFHHGQAQLHPVIPGSSLRGMLRQMVEVLSDGALTTATTTEIVYRAVGDSRTRLGLDYRKRFVGASRTAMQYPLTSVRGGYLFQQGREWFIQPAVADARHFGECFVRYNGNLPPGMTAPGEYPVWVSPAPRASWPHCRGAFRFTLTDPRTTTVPIPRSAPCPIGFVAAVLVVTADVGGNKHMHLAIFEPDTTASPLRVAPKARRQFEDDFEIERNAPGRWPTNAATPPRLAVPQNPANGWPCFYMVDAAGGIVYFGGTLFFRLPYTKAPAAFAHPMAADDLPLRLFGRVGLSHSRVEVGSTLRGRVRFEDAAWDERGGDPFVTDPGDYLSPAVLLAPKPACIQHYLVQPDTDTREIRHYDDLPVDPARPGLAGCTMLRGFKHYWHRRSVDGVLVATLSSQRWDHAEVAQHSRIRTVIHPVRENVRFSGRIRFENVSDEELGALLLALDPGPSKRHKLGMARKHGYGSVKITIDKVKLRDPETHYATFFKKKDSSLNAGWKLEQSTADIRDAARKAFASRLIAHRGDAVADDLSADQIVETFWRHPRMMELAELLEWDHAPHPSLTREVGVDHDAASAQWCQSQRYLLPTPFVVSHPSDDIWHGRPDPPAQAAPMPLLPDGSQLGAPRTVDPKRPVASAPPPRHDWRGVLLALDPGSGTLRIQRPETRAESYSPDAEALRRSLPDGSQAKLRKKHELRVDAIVEERPNPPWRIVSVSVT